MRQYFQARPISPKEPVTRHVVELAVAVLCAASAYGAIPRPQCVYLPAHDVQCRGGEFAAERKKLMAVDPAALLYAWRSAAGLPAKCDPPKSPGERDRETAGRSLGHYLSAMSALSAGNRDETAKDRVDYVVEELYGCAQACTAKEKFFATVPEGEWFANDAPAFPPRTAYAMLRGLFDASELAGNKRAFDLARGWVDHLRTFWGRPRGDEMRRRNEARERWLQGDWGGLNRAFLDVYDGFKLVSYYHDGWNYFNQRPFFDKLRKGEYDFRTESAASLAAKMGGLYHRHRITGWEELRKAAFAYLDFAAKDPNYGADDPEATFDLLTLAASAFEERPSAALMDYVDSREALLAKWALSSARVGPADVYAACSARYAYATSPKTVWINQYVPSAAVFREKRIVLVAESDCPNCGHARITVRMKTPKILQRFRFRRVKGAMPSIMVNGSQVIPLNGEDGYVTVERAWTDGDVIEIALRQEAL